MTMNTVAQTELKNVVTTYLEMRTTRDGVTARVAIKDACAATGKKYNDSYLTRWKNAATPVPDPVVAWMQEQVQFWVFERIGVKPGVGSITLDQMREINESLKIPVKVVKDTTPTKQVIRRRIANMKHNAPAQDPLIV